MKLEEMFKLLVLSQNSLLVTELRLEFGSPDLWLWDLSNIPAAL